MKTNMTATEEERGGGVGSVIRKGKKEEKERGGDSLRRTDVKGKERGLEMIPQLDIKRLLFSLPFLHTRSLGHTEEGGGALFCFLVEGGSIAPFLF